LVLIFASLASQSALAQFVQQGPKLVGTGAIGPAIQGYSVALSGDGNTAIVGAPTDSNTGAEWVFAQHQPLQVTPATYKTASGRCGGTFSPKSFKYRVRAVSASANYSITNVPSWAYSLSTSRHGDFAIGKDHHLAGAVKLMREYFWPHARAALRRIGLTDRNKDLRRALRWMQASRLPMVSLKDIRREALGGSLDADQTRDLLDRLEVAGWLRLEKTETGGRPRERWSVNPRVFEIAPAGTARTAERV
jgi:hypothetical protein